jgi:hypothetical protein
VAHFAVGAGEHTAGSHLEHGRGEVAEEGRLVVGVGLHELARGAGGGLQGCVGEQEALPRHHVLVVLVVKAHWRARVQKRCHISIAVLRAEPLQLCEVGFLQRRIRLARVPLVVQPRLEARAARFPNCVRPWTAI